MPYLSHFLFDLLAWFGWMDLAVATDDVTRAVAGASEETTPQIDPNG